MARVVDENGYPIDEEYNISELKQITESSNIKADADPNKMHYDSIRDMARSVDETEAKIILEILSCRYPDLVCSSLAKRVEVLQTSMDRMIGIMEEFK